MIIPVFTEPHIWVMGLPANIQLPIYPRIVITIFYNDLVI